MIFQNIDFHNVEEIEKTDKGYVMRRLPLHVREKVNEGVKNNIFGTGIELRFKMTDGACDIILASDYLAEAPVASIFFGSIQGGWEYSTKMIYENETVIHIEYPSNLEKLAKISKDNELAFSPEIVRVVLPYTNCYYVGVEGKVLPPSKEEVPSETYLAYGSSITHGSLGLMMPYSYPFRISQKLNCDYINMGFAGSALMEEELASYIVSRNDWTFASVEMGINALSDKISLSDEQFEQRIDRFTKILGNDKRPVFATSIFGFNGDKQEKGERFRNIVRKYAKERLIFMDGLDILNESKYISADLTHPTLEGMEQIADRWGREMEMYLRNQKSI